MIKLLKYTYILDNDRIKSEIDKLWSRYQEILNHPNWDDLNEARAILYLLGNFYCEKIAPEAIGRRLHLLEKPMELLDFLTAVDSNSENLPELRKDKLFSDLEKFYLLIKRFKNKDVGGKFYIDEERFIRLYNEYNPDKDLKLGYRGKFKN